MNRNVLDTVKLNQMDLAQLPCAVGDYSRDCSFAVHALGFSLLSCDYRRKEGHFMVPYSGQATNPMTIYIQSHGESS